MIDSDELLKWIQKEKLLHNYFDSEIPRIDPHESKHYIDMENLNRYIISEAFKKWVDKLTIHDISNFDINYDNITVKFDKIFSYTEDGMDHVKTIKNKWEKEFSLDGIKVDISIDTDKLNDLIFLVVTIDCSNLPDSEFLSNEINAKG